MTPGRYIRVVREGFGWSLDQLAARIATEPRLDERARRDILAAIEADEQPARFDTLVAIRSHIPVNLAVLERLELQRLGYSQTAPRICEGCGAWWNLDTQQDWPTDNDCGRHQGLAA